MHLSSAAETGPERVPPAAGLTNSTAGGVVSGPAPMVHARVAGVESTFPAGYSLACLAGTEALPYGTPEHAP